jgi:hypothetical protein
VPYGTFLGNSGIDLQWPAIYSSPNVLTTIKCTKAQNDVTNTVPTRIGYLCFSLSNIYIFFINFS